MTTTGLTSKSTLTMIIPIPHWAILQIGLSCRQFGDKGPCGLQLEPSQSRFDAAGYLNFMKHIDAVGQAIFMIKCRLERRLLCVLSHSVSGKNVLYETIRSCRFCSRRLRCRHSRASF